MVAKDLQSPVVIFVRDIGFKTACLVLTLSWLIFMLQLHNDGLGLILNDGFEIKL